MRKYRFLIALLFIFAPAANAQTLAPDACQQFFSASGIPLAGGFLWSYIAGTSTPTPTYADSAVSISNSNPIILNAGGYPVSATGGCGIWLSNSVSYKFVVQNSTHTAQWTVDNITGNGSTLLTSANTWSMLQTFSAGITGTGNIGTLSLGSTALGANNAWTGNNSHTGAEVFKYLNNIRFADQFAGADCGAKINAADTDLGSTVGEIWVNQNCGTTWTTAVSLSAKHTVRFIQGGTYVHAGITFGQGASVIGPPCGDADSVNTCPVVLRSSTTLASALNLSGNESSCRDITLDGNSTGVLGALVTAQRVELNHCHAWRFTSHGIEVASTTSSNDSAGAVRVVGVMSIANGGDGLYCSAATDGVIGAQHSEFENNTGFGLEASDCSGWRVMDNDFGGNTSGGIKITGLNGGWQGLGWTITANEFGNNKSHDIFIDGNNSGLLASRDIAIVGNYFNGLGFGATDNTYSGIHIQNSTGNTVTGNICRSGSSPRYKYCIEITQPTLTEGTDTLAGDNFEGSFGTGYIFPQAATMCASNNDPSNLCAFKIPTGYAFTSAGIPINGSSSGTVTLAATSTGGNLTVNGSQVGTIASGTTSLTSGSVSGATCQARVSSTATGALTTDSIEWSYATAPTVTTDALLMVSPDVSSAGNVGFTRCNATAGSITGTAIIVNWRVVR